MTRIRTKELKERVQEILGALAEVKNAQDTMRISLSELDSVLRIGKGDDTLEAMPHLKFASWDQYPDFYLEPKARNKLTNILKLLVDDGIVYVTGGKRKTYHYMTPNEQARRVADHATRKARIEKAIKILQEHGIDDAVMHVYSGDKIVLSLTDLEKLTNGGR
jgi:hypothetical protein